MHGDGALDEDGRQRAPATGAVHLRHRAGQPLCSAERPFGEREGCPAVLSLRALRELLFEVATRQPASPASLDPFASLVWALDARELDEVGPRQARLDAGHRLDLGERPASRHREAKPQGTTAEYFALWQAVGQGEGGADLGLRAGTNTLPLIDSGALRARATGMSRQRVRRMLEERGVELFVVAGRPWVPLPEIVAKLEPDCVE